MADAAAYVDLFDKKMTARIKGVALIFMLIHHFFGQPGWYVPGIDYSTYNILGANIAYWVQDTSKICVPLFAFLTGWGYFFVNDKSWKYSCRKIIFFLINYWIILFGIFLPCYMAFSDEKISILRVAANMLALEPDGIVKFAWYVYFYVFTMLILPFWCRKLSGKIALDMGITVASCVFFINLGRYFCVLQNFVIFISEILDCFYWFTCVAAGYICAREKVFHKIYHFFYYPSKLKSLLVIFIVLGCRMKWLTVIGVPLDMFYASIMIFELINLLNDSCCRTCNKILEFAGHHATNVWFLHSVFFDESTNFLQKYVYLLKNPILVVVSGFLICLPFSLCINWIMKHIANLVKNT